MKRTLFNLLIVPLLLNTLYGQTFYHEGDTLYVWASSGLNIRESFEKSSEIIGNISFGEKIVILKTGDNKSTELRVKSSCLIDSKPTNEFFLKGKMTMIRYKELEGYVFDAFLSRFTPIPTEYILFNFNEFLENKFDTLQILKTYTGDNTSEQIILSNGINIYTKTVSTCGQITYIIPDITFQEGFLIAYRLLHLEKKELNQNDCQWYKYDSGYNFVEIWVYDDLLYKVSIRQINNFVSITI